MYKNTQQINFNAEQQSVFNGIMLGDGFMYKTRKTSSPYFSVQRAIKDIEYLKFQYSYFSNLCNRDVFSLKSKDKRDNKIREYCYFYTKCLTNLEPYYNTWYPNGIKVVPNIKLDNYTVCHWYYDDGCLSRLSKSNNSIGITLATNSFSYKDVEFLLDQLENMYGKYFDISRSNKSKEDKNFFIRASSKGAYNLLYSIKDCYKVDDSMSRKMIDFSKEISLREPNKNILLHRSGMFKEFILSKKEFTIKDVGKYMNWLRTDGIVPTSKVKRFLQPYVDNKIITYKIDKLDSAGKEQLIYSVS